MCNCKIQNDLNQTLKIHVENDSIWIYDSVDEFIGNFKINFCPICGEKVSEDFKNFKYQRMKSICRKMIIELGKNPDDEEPFFPSICHTKEWEDMRSAFNEMSDKWKMEKRSV